jgi:hypothetical protein
MRRRRHSPSRKIIEGNSTAMTYKYPPPEVTKLSSFNPGVDLLRRAPRLWRPCQLQSLVGQEHGWTIPLMDIRRFSQSEPRT